MSSAFTVVQVRVERLKVSWEFHNEGYKGTYDPKDPEDDKLLRFTCYKRLRLAEDREEEAWLEVPNGSHCTGLPVGTEWIVLVDVATRIINILRTEADPRTRLELLGWTSLDNLVE